MGPTEDSHPLVVAAATNTNVWVFQMGFNQLRAEPIGRRNHKRLYVERHPHLPPNPSETVNADHC